MDNLTRNKDLYQGEIEYSDKLSNKNVQLLTLLTVIGGGEIIVLQEIFPLQFTWWEIIYCIICLASVTSFLIAVIFFIKSYQGYAYSYIPISAINKTCAAKLKEFKDKDVPPNKTTEYINDMYFDMLSTLYLTCALQNRTTNIMKASNNRKVTYAIIINFFILFINFILYMIIHHLKEGDLYVF